MATFKSLAYTQWQRRLSNLLFVSFHLYMQNFYLCIFSGRNNLYIRLVYWLYLESCIAVNIITLSPSVSPCLCNFLFLFSLYPFNPYLISSAYSDSSVGKTMWLKLCAFSSKSPSSHTLDMDTSQTDSNNISYLFFTNTKQTQRMQFSTPFVESTKL